MAEVDLTIAGRPYRVACRTGEEDSLRAAAALVDAKSREALAGLGTMSDRRQPPARSRSRAPRSATRRTRQRAGRPPGGAGRLP